MPSPSSPRADGLRDRGIEIKSAVWRATLDDVHVGVADKLLVVAVRGAMSCSAANAAAVSWLQELTASISMFSVMSRSGRVRREIHPVPATPHP
jgi:hypothetical protein